MIWHSSHLPFFTDSNYHHTYLYLWQWHYFLVSMPESYSIMNPNSIPWSIHLFLTVYFLYIHLWALGMLLQCMLSCLWFSKSVYFWSILGVERPSHTVPFVSVKSHGQWFLYWLFPLIRLTSIKGSPSLMLTHHFWSRPFSMVAFSSAQIWHLVAV